MANFGTFTAGQVLTDTELDKIGGAWVTSWTPTWTGITLGNGATGGKFIRIGRTVIFRAYILFGNSTSVTGGINLDVPVTAAQAEGAMINADLLDASFGMYRGMARLTTTTNISVNAMNSGSTYVAETSTSSTVPFTWAASDTIWVTGVYESASDPT